MLYNIEQIKERIVLSMQHHEVIKVVLFGSFARGTADDGSDIDLMIAADTNKRFLDRIDDLQDLYDVLPGTGLDILVYTPEELDNMTGNPFITSIMKEGITLYER